MKLLAHFLADSANFSQDGTFTVFKGGITEVNAADFPTLSKFVVVTRIEFTPDEASKLHHLQLHITLPDSSHVSGQRQPIVVRLPDPNAQHVYANVISQMNIAFARAGETIIGGELDGEGMPLLYLAVRKVDVI